MKPNENELKTKICPRTLYLSHCNESRPMFGGKLGKLSWFFFFFFFTA